MRLRALALLLTLLGCGPEPPPPVGSQGLLELLEPAAPIGLHYGEKVRIRVRYLLRGQPRPGVALAVTSAGQLRGSSLSAARVLTDGHGEAAFLLQAGAAETAFQVLVSGPDAQDLTVDVAVSRHSFGGLAVYLDRRTLAGAGRVRALRASLLLDERCAELRPTLKPPAALRTMRVELRPGEEEATLLFETLLLRSYTVVGRAEAEDGRPLGWGCAELPEQALRWTEARLELPLGDVYPRPAGTYRLRADLELDLGPLWSPWATLACPLGAGQALLDALLQALPAPEMPLASRLQARRGALGADRCRPARRGTEDTADLLLSQLIGQSRAGAQLRPVALDVRALQRRFHLVSLLTVRGETPRGLVADHGLLQVELETGAASARYDLAGLGLPVLEARDLLLPMTGDRLDLPTHGLCLRLPQLWRRALADVVLGPRMIASLETLLRDSITAARHDGRTGCAAVEELLCELAGPPCAAVLQRACQDGERALLRELEAALGDGPEGLDLSLAGFVHAEDPEETLTAAALGMGQAQGRVELGSGAAAASGPLGGTRP